MPIRTFGPLSITDIVAEFGGTAPHDLSKYYRGGGLVPNKNINSAIAAAGSNDPISLGQFYGASKIIELTYSMYGGGAAGGQGFENGTGTGRAGSGQDTVIMLRSEYNALKAANGGNVPNTIDAARTLARAAGGLGGAHGSRQILPGGDGGTTDFGAGGSGGAVNTAAPASVWGRWGIGGGGGGGDQGNGSSWGFFGLVKYGSSDSWGQSGDGGAAGEKAAGTVDLDVEVDYVLIAGKAGAPGTGVGNHNGAYGVPGIIEFTVDTVSGTNYDVTPAGDGSSNTHRITSTVIGMRLDRSGVPSFFAV
jgi:hypothetical protein